MNSGGIGPAPPTRAGTDRGGTGTLGPFTGQAQLGMRLGRGPLFLKPEGMEMATRDHTKDQKKAADEAARTARTVTDEAAGMGEQAARAGADVFRRSTETARDTLHAGLNTANQTFQRMTDQFNQTLGFNGPQAEE